MLDGDEKQEIIIIKRSGGGEDGHHGGAWKIAFADFMTAMMALFLVLWLVNAANEETKKSVASYFNPVKLVDRNRSLKGLEESAGPQAEGNESSDQPDLDDSTSKADSETDTAKAGDSDVELFRDPFKILAQIETSEIENINQAELIAAVDTSTGAPSEDAFLDPFAQSSEPIKQNPASDPASGQPLDRVETGSVPDDVAPTKPESDRVDQESAIAEAASAAPPSEEPSPELPENVLEDDEPRENKPEQQQENLEQGDAVDQAKQQEIEAQKIKERDERLERVSAEILREIRTSLKETLGDNEKLSNSLAVEVTSDGVLISITDQFGFSMFQIGSAVPKGQLVLAMNEIARILAQRKGPIRIYGHTDARPYSSTGAGGYDNWRLSTARAHSARFMLTRSGFEEERISQVVGFADRRLRTPEAPEAESNRRIEILLEIS